MGVRTDGHRAASTLHCVRGGGNVRRSVLVAQASTHGPASGVAELVAETLGAHGLSVDLIAASRVETLDRYGAVVVGGPMRLGRWHREVGRFLQRHRTVLARLPVAVFATERRAGEHRGSGIERALANAPEIEPVTSGLFVVAPHDGGPRYAAAEVRRWANELAAELGA
jgi:flavodoxin